MSDPSRFSRAVFPWWFAVCALVGCSDSKSPHRGASRVEHRAAVVNAFVFADDRFAAVLGPLPDPVDNPLWHRDRLRERLGITDPDVEFVSLRLYRVDSTDAGSKFADPTLADLRLQLLDGDRVVEAVPLEVAPPRAGEDPALRVLRARTLEPFSQARLAPGSGVEVWFRMASSTLRRTSGARVSFGGKSLELEARTIEAEQIAALIERPTRESLRAMAVRPRTATDTPSVSPVSPDEVSR